IVSHNLTLTSDGGSVGTPEQHVAGVLTTLNSQVGVLRATAGIQGVYLDLGSGAIIQQVRAGNADTGFGNVVINATGDLTVPSSNASVNVAGNNVTITSTSGGVGLQSLPLILTANGTPGANGVTGGVVNVHALDDIALKRLSGDLLIGAIVSSAGNV